MDEGWSIVEVSRVGGRPRLTPCLAVAPLKILSPKVEADYSTAVLSSYGGGLVAGDQGLTSAMCPIMAFSVAEDELRAMDTEFLVGHLAAWNYFQSVATKENRDFVKSFKQYCVANDLPGGLMRVTDDPILWAYTGVYLWIGWLSRPRSVG